MLEISHLKLFGGQTRIAEIDKLVVNRHEKMVIVGDNGSGKTTLLKTIAGLHKDYQGEVDCRIQSLSSTYVHQEPIMFRGDVRKNVSYGLRVRRLATQDVAERVSGWSDKLGLQALLTRNTQTLSGGEKKRVALIRAMITQPQLLLLDEPLSELDEHFGAELIEILLSLDKTTVISTAPGYDKKFDEFTRFDLSQAEAKLFSKND